MTSRFSRLGAAGILAVTLAVATACAAPEPEPTESASAAPTATSPAPEPSAEETTEPDAAPDPTCETIIPESTVADFESVGWTVQADRFYIGDIEVPDGLMCVWADFDAPAGDHLQLYGWAPISDGLATEAQDSLVSQGWMREESAEGVYITENPETTIAVDENGYGMTYLFADGAVKLADTKQGLLLVEWPNG